MRADSPVKVSSTTPPALFIFTLRDVQRSVAPPAGRRRKPWLCQLRRVLFGASDQLPSTCGPEQGGPLLPSRRGLPSPSRLAMLHDLELELKSETLSGACWERACKANLLSAVAVAVAAVTVVGVAVAVGAVALVVAVDVAVAVAVAVAVVVAVAVAVVAVAVAAVELVSIMRLVCFCFGV